MVESLPLLRDRDGLPQGLRYLVEALPRAGWESHPNFGGLVSFWLDRHGMFRELHGRMATEAQDYLDGDSDEAAWRPRLLRLGTLLLDHLQGHHQIEDVQFFPMLAQMEPRAALGFAMLERDHEELHQELADFAARAEVVLRAGPADLNDAAGALLTGLGGLGRFLDRHLSDEEDLAVPVILKTGLG